MARLRYDHAGRLSSKRTALEVETEGFSYDVQDQLKQVRRSGAVAEDLEYDPFGAVLFRKVATRAYYYAGAQATLTADVSSTCNYATCAPVNVQVGVHVLLGGTRVATVRPSDVLYYHRDLRGSVVATTRTGGVVGARYRWGPYGELEWSEGDDGVSGSELGYTGGLRLGWASGSQSGALVLLGARVYDAALKRWLQPDTVELERYSYAGGDPVNLVDPTGREPLASGASPPAASSGNRGDQGKILAAWSENGWSCQMDANGASNCVTDVTNGEKTAPMPVPFPVFEPTPPSPPYTPKASDMIWNQRPPAGEGSVVSGTSRPSWATIFKHRLYAKPASWGRDVGIEVATRVLEGKAIVVSLTPAAGSGIAPLGASVAKLGDAIYVAGSNAARAVVGSWGGVVLGTVEEAAVEATYTVVAYDVYVVLSRGRGGGPAQGHAP